MHVVVVGQDLGPEVRLGAGASGKEWEHGRYWTVETFYLYTLLWDPFILHRTRAAPLYDQPCAAMNGSAAQTLLFYAHSTPTSDQQSITELLNRGGRAVLQQPAVELLNAIDGLKVADAKRPCLTSLRERWDLGEMSSRAYYYPHRQPFLRLSPGNARVLSRIGDNPDLVVLPQAAVWAGNVFVAAASYRNMPGVLSELLADIAVLMGQVVGAYTNQPLAGEEARRLVETFELRRDFHSLGYAYLTMQELAQCHGREVAGLADVELLAVSAATDLAEGRAGAAQDQLARAFKLLERINRTQQPVPAVFTDTLHGGELYPDIGYFEIDWPQHPADVLRTYMHWAKTRSYRFNVDLGATTVREMALRFPELFAQMKVAQDEQIVEFVNGSCNQPYPPLHSLESQIRQFDVGVQVWQDVFGRTPRTYASQEFGFCPQIAAVLSQQGYQQAVVRVQNMGDAPTLRDEQIEWIAPSGDRLRALPSHPHKSEQLNWFTYNNLHLKLYLHQRQTPDFAVFTCLGDITYHRPMREELARVCHYAPVFGRFSTFSEYFDATRERHAPEHQFRMQDFHCDAGFLNLDLWPIYTDNTGNFNANCIRSLAATNLFAAAELLDGMTTCSKDGPPGSHVDHDAHWEALALYQGHGTYIVPKYPSGAFLGGIDSPTTRQVGHGVPNVAEYIGPSSQRLIKDVTGPLMDAAERNSALLVQERLRSLMREAGRDGGGYVLYSFAPERRKVVTLPAGAGQSLKLGGNALATQDSAEDLLTIIDLPMYGYALVDALPEADIQVDISDPVSMGADYLENRELRVEFDLANGTIRRLFDKVRGCELLQSGSHAFYCPECAPARCVGVRSVAAGSLRGCLEFDIEVPIKDHKPCMVRTRAWLDSEQSIVEFETDVLQSPSLSGNQWDNHVGVRFALADAQPTIHTCHFNVLEPNSGEQLFSPNVLMTQGNKGSAVFFNEGNEFYLKKGNTISNILVVQNETVRRFRYAVGVAGANPFMQARSWVQPVITLRIPQHGKVARIRADVNNPSKSFISFDSPDVELLSCRLKDGVFRVRLANTAGRNVRTRLWTAEPILSAELTSLAGSHAVEQLTHDGHVSISLRPWDIRQLEIRLHTRFVTPRRKSTVRADALQQA